MGSGLKTLTWVRSGQFFAARVGSAIFGLGLGLENFPQKSQIFKFFSPRVKKIALGWVKKYPGQSQVSLLFTGDQKYARVRSDQGPSLNQTLHSFKPGHFPIIFDLGLLQKYKKICPALLLTIVSVIIDLVYNLIKMHQLLN